MHCLVDLRPDGTVKTLIRASVLPDELPEGLIEITEEQALGLKVGAALKAKLQPEKL